MLLFFQELIVLLYKESGSPRMAPATRSGEIVPALLKHRVLTESSPNLRS
ncbi:MAG: hypothetical protein V2I54_01410 [Bacteroidales bacterium]|nr:hypothetical protein [Bacteroidales bacterium]